MIENREEIEDTKIFDEAMARGEESFPAEVVERLIAGESTVKVFREYRGLSHSDLAKSAGIKESQLKEVERGEQKQDKAVLGKLARALNLDLCDLI